MANSLVLLSILVIIAVSACDTGKKRKQTLIVMTLDESRSMKRNRRQTMSAYNDFLQGQRANTDTEAFLSLIKFGRTAKTVHGIRPIENVSLLDGSNYRPKGCTPLYDAIALAIATADASAMAYDQVIIVIITDGKENCSR